MKVMKYLKPMWVVDCIGPHISKFTNSRNMVVLVTP